MEEKRYYDEDEAEQILKLAAKRAGAHGSIPREQLLASAAELGISPEDLRQAEIEFQKTSTETRDRREFEAERRREFFSHVGYYLLVNAGLFCFDFISDGRISWAYWPLAAWGVALLLGGMSNFAKSGAEYDSQFDAWRKERLRKTAGYPEAKEVIESLEGTMDIRREKIKAIGEIRERTGLDLKDSKNALDEYLHQTGG